MKKNSVMHWLLGSVKSVHGGCKIVIHDFLSKSVRCYNKYPVTKTYKHWNLMLTVKTSITIMGNSVT